MRLVDLSQPWGYDTPLTHDLVHVENIGSDIALLLNRRVTISVFPWRFRGGEAAMCRVVAFLDD